MLKACDSYVYDYVDFSKMRQIYSIVIFHEKKRKNDVADTARNPNGNKKKRKNSRIRSPCKGLTDRHDDMKKRSPGAYQNMSGVRKLRFREPVRYRYPDNSKGIDQPPFLDKPDMNVPVRHVKKHFAEIRDQGIAKRRDAYRPHISDNEQDPKIAFAFYVRAGSAHVKPVNRSCDKGAQDNMKRVKGIEKLVRDAGRYFLGKNHDNYTGKRPKKSERGVVS